MGKAGKRKEMVEDRCVQEMRVDVRCVKEVRVKVLLVKEVCVKAWCKNVVCANVLYVQVLWISGGWSCNVAITDVPTPWVEVNGNRGSWQHVQGSPRRPSWERTVCSRFLADAKGCLFARPVKRTVVRRGTWQVRQVRHQRHALRTQRCSDSWLVGQLLDTCGAVLTCARHGGILCRRVRATPCHVATGERARWRRKGTWQRNVMTRGRGRQTGVKNCNRWQ